MTSALGQAEYKYITRGYSANQKSAIDLFIFRANIKRASYLQLAISTPVVNYKKHKAFIVIVYEQAQYYFKYVYFELEIRHDLAFDELKQSPRLNFE